MKLQIDYFRESGKWYTGGTMELPDAHPFEIIREVGVLWRSDSGMMPEVTHPSQFNISITPLDSETFTWPHLFIRSTVEAEQLQQKLEDIASIIKRG